MLLSSTAPPDEYTVIACPWLPLSLSCVTASRAAIVFILLVVVVLVVVGTVVVVVPCIPCDNGVIRQLDSILEALFGL